MLVTRHSGRGRRGPPRHGVQSAQPNGTVEEESSGCGAHLLAAVTALSRGWDERMCVEWVFWYGELRRWVERVCIERVSWGCLLGYLERVC